MRSHRGAESRKRSANRRQLAHMHIQLHGLEGAREAQGILRHGVNVHSILRHGARRAALGTARRYRRRRLGLQGAKPECEHLHAKALRRRQIAPPTTRHLVTSNAEVAQHGLLGAVARLGGVDGPSRAEFVQDARRCRERSRRDARGGAASARRNPATGGRRCLGGAQCGAQCAAGAGHGTEEHARFGAAAASAASAASAALSACEGVDASYREPHVLCARLEHGAGLDGRDACNEQRARRPRVGRRVGRVGPTKRSRSVKQDSQPLDLRAHEHVRLDGRRGRFRSRRRTGFRTLMRTLMHICILVQGEALNTWTSDSRSRFRSRR